MESIFARLPQAFFVPLASPNRRHYATLLLLYYRLFLDYRSGVERELVVARFAEYFAGLDAADAVEKEEESEAEASGPEPRNLATQFLRKLVSYGWVSEEEQLDFTRVVNLCTHARPFLEANDLDRELLRCHRRGNAGGSRHGHRGPFGNGALL